jgi:hypothetical protein
MADAQDLKLEILPFLRVSLGFLEVCSGRYFIGQKSLLA